MTEDQLRAAWTRYMHRLDIEADLDVVHELSRARIEGSIMRTLLAVPDSEAAPAVWLHAGLMQLHELAQDDEGLAREAQLFERALVDFEFRWSIDNVDAVMVPGGGM